MEIIIKVNGKIIKNMDKALWFFQTEINIRDIGKTINLMEKEVILKKTVKNMKGIL